MNSYSYLVAFFCLFATVASEVLVGNFQNYAHGIGGEVYIKDEKTLFIKGFTYDGAGPDAFFWVGTSQAPSAVGTILPYPFEGKFYNYEDREAPILTRRFNNEDVTLTLPDDLKATDLKWMSVWCRQFRVNFGDIFFPADLSVHSDDESADAETTDELPPPIKPVPNAHDPTRHDEDWKEDSDVAYSEAESEAESEGEAEGSATSLFVGKFTVMFLAIVGAYLV